MASGRWPAMSCGCDFSPTFPIWVPLVAFVMSVTSAVASLARQFEDANLQDNWCSLVPRLGRLAESDGIGDGGVPLYRVVPKGRDIWTRRSVEARSRLNSKQYRRGSRACFDRRIQAIPRSRTRVAARGRNSTADRAGLGVSPIRPLCSFAGGVLGGGPSPEWPYCVADAKSVAILHEDDHQATTH